MTAVPTDETSLRALVYGGAVLGGGGGGSIGTGLASVRQALRAGSPRIVSIAEVASDTVLATLSAVGSAEETSGAMLGPAHFQRAIELFEPFARCKIGGFIASEVGPRAVTYGLVESARSSIPVVDAPANGRAHPLFAMGSLGLHRYPRHVTVAVAVGGPKGSGDYLELAMRANVTKAAHTVRERAAQGNLALAVVRNPLPARYVSDHAAVGGLLQAQRVGRVLLARLPNGAAAVLPALARIMGGRIVATGRIERAALKARHGFSIGRIMIRCCSGSAIELAVCNEFMAVLDRGKPVVVFPDLIAVFDCLSGLPLASVEAQAGRKVAVLVVPRSRLVLGSTMDDIGLLRQIEGPIGVDLTSSVEPQKRDPSPRRL